MAVVAAATSSPKTEAAPRLPFDRDGCPALSLRGPRSSGPVAERFGLAVPDDDAMLGVRRSGAFGADGLGLPGLPQRTSQRDAFAAPTGERSSSRFAVGAGRFYSETVNKAREATVRAADADNDGAPRRGSTWQAESVLAIAPLAWRCKPTPCSPPPRAPSKAARPHRRRPESVRSPVGAMSRRRGAAQIDAFGK